MALVIFIALILDENQMKTKFSEEKKERISLKANLDTAATSDSEVEVRL